MNTTFARSRTVPLRRRRTLGVAALAAIGAAFTALLACTTGAATPPAAGDADITVQTIAHTTPNNPTVARDDYDGYTYGALNTLDPKTDFFIGQCTDFVARRLQHEGLTQFTDHYQERGGLWGNAGQWKAAAQRAGIPVDQTPAAGAVAYFPPGVDGAGTFGHVGMVMQVDSPAHRILVEDYNWDGPWDGKAPGHYAQHWVSDPKGLLSYIHFAVTSGGSPAPPSTPPARGQGRTSGQQPGGAGLHRAGHAHSHSRTAGHTRHE